MQLYLKPSQRNVVLEFEKIFIFKVEVLNSEDDNGMNFTVHVNAVSTYCRKGVHFSELENCPINPDESVKECKLPVYRKNPSNPKRYNFGQITCNIPEEPRFNFQSVPLDAITSEQFPQLKSNAGNFSFS